MYKRTKERTKLSQIISFLFLLVSVNSVELESLIPPRRKMSCQGLSMERCLSGGIRKETLMFSVKFYFRRTMTNLFKCSETGSPIVAGLYCSFKVTRSSQVVGTRAFGGLTRIASFLFIQWKSNSSIREHAAITARLVA